MMYIFIIILTVIMVFWGQNLLYPNKLVLKYWDYYQYEKKSRHVSQIQYWTK